MTLQTTLFRDSYIKIAEELVELGGSVRTLAVHFGVARQTIAAWRKDHPKFDLAIKQAAQRLDAEVAGALFKNAIGYYYHVEEPVKYKTADGGERVKVVKLKKYKPAETKAGIHWLAMRQKELWGDKVPNTPNDLETLLKIMNKSRGLPSAQANPKVAGNGAAEAPAPLPH